MEGTCITYGIEDADGRNIYLLWYRGWRWKEHISLMVWQMQRGGTYITYGIENADRRNMYHINKLLRFIVHV